MVSLIIKMFKSLMKVFSDGQMKKYDMTSSLVGAVGLYCCPV
jgi:hypothetical protein